ncbi:MAG: radical SAM family heme chaperone HemW [Caulobacterales bacterium]
MTAFGIYLHWPYCSRICPYCDFNVYRAKGADSFALLQAIEKDIYAHAEKLGRRQADTLFLGGGTPSLMSGAEIAHIVDIVDRAFGLALDAEITLECNPEDARRVRDQAAAGVNRFSLGVQALDDAALKALGRAHDSEKARKAIEAAARTDRRVSLDLIYARENQSIAAWAHELTEALKLPVEHVSLYQLTIEEGTAFDRAVKRGTLNPPSGEVAASMYEITQEICASAGFPAYEISNHARGADAQSEHNLLYWRGHDWIGVGPGGHGRFRLGGERMATESVPAPAAYIEAVNANGIGWESAAVLSQEEERDEALLMGLRVAEGLDRARLLSAPPSEDKIAGFVADGLLIATPHRLKLTERGRLFADRIASELSLA